MPRSGKPCGSSIRLARRSFGRRPAAGCSTRAEAPSSSSKASSLSWASVPLDEFFENFPEGTYTFLGRTPDGERLASTVEFTHVIPAGPEIVLPVGSSEECTENVPIPAVIAWNDVTTTIDDSPLEVDRYEVIVENDESNFDVHMAPGADTQITVPSEFLTPGTEYNFEVLAIEAGGNQTITEGCFVTAE